MNKHLFYFLALALSYLIDIQPSFSQVKSNLREVPAFEENKGQVNGMDADRVKFVFKQGNLSLFLLNDGIAYQFNKLHYPKGYKQPEKWATNEEIQISEALSKEIRQETYRMDVSLVGANPEAKISTENKSSDYIQYYNHDALNVYRYDKVTYHDVYPKIDWVVYKNKNNIKYDFIVHPGGNPSQIKLQTRWVEDMELGSNGNLNLKNCMGNITEEAPLSFQDGKEILTRFVIEQGVVGFDLQGYNPLKTLVIDPTLLWATYYGDSDPDWGRSCATDASGNVYMAGETNSSGNIASGGHQNTFGGSSDAFLVKFNSNGIRQWCTYYGGNGTEMGYSCTADPSGNIYLAGATSSLNNIAYNGHQNTYNGGTGIVKEAFLVKFNGLGVRQWATYYGGSGNDLAYSCATDKFSNVYLAGSTESLSNIASNGHQNTYAGGENDAFLAKFNSNGERQWGSYYGGNGRDLSYSCATDVSNRIYLAGSTNSVADIAFGGYQDAFAGGEYGDAFLVGFDTDGIRQWATYYGGSNSDAGISCATDASGNIYLTGGTSSNSGIASGGFQNTYGGGNDAFLVKFNMNGVRQWATYYGANGDDFGWFCATDLSDNIYIGGSTRSESDIASGGFQNSYGGGMLDVYVVKFDGSGTRSWATYYGGSEADHGVSCTTDFLGNVYIAGTTFSFNSIAYNGHQNTFGGNCDAFLAKLDKQGNNVSIQELPAAGKVFHLYPNPVKDVLRIELEYEMKLRSIPLMVS